MRRFVISIIILSLIIISAFSLPIYFKKTTLELTQKIDEININIKNNNKQEAISKTYEFSKFWHDKKNIITVFVNNDEIDHITYSISRLVPLLKYNNISEFSSNLSYIKILIISIYIDDIPSLSNIF
ncbi:MAG: DUF4363 family protein [Oscillospiraceae bacterium]|nr:DUF4363 family protein [Oscillospiraceae bacterium]